MRLRVHEGLDHVVDADQSARSADTGVAMHDYWRESLRSFISLIKHALGEGLVFKDALFSFISLFCIIKAINLLISMF